MISDVLLLPDIRSKNEQHLHIAKLSKSVHNLGYHPVLKLLLPVELALELEGLNMSGEQKGSFIQHREEGLA
jgi:hypothetical protein